MGVTVIGREQQTHNFLSGTSCVLSSGEGWCSTFDNGASQQPHSYDYV